MSIFAIVWKSIRQRSLGTILTAISIALGTGLVLLILSLREEVERSFSQNSVGYEMLVGAKGSPMQLVLNTIYGLGAPVGNIPYAYYERIASDRMVRLAVPVTVGDNHRGFRVIGTTPAFFNEFNFQKNRRFEIAEGRIFAKEFEAVLGARAAKETGIRVGDTFTPAHGVSAEEGGEEHDDAKTTVVGIMGETGTPMDRGIYITQETVWRIHADESSAGEDPAYSGMTPEQIEQMKQLEAMEGGDTASHNTATGEDHIEKDVPDSLKTITAIFVNLKNKIVFDRFRRAVLDEPVAQAIIPAMEIRNLFDIIGNINGVLLAIAYIVVLVAMAGVLVSIYNTMNERRREIAIMRALGAQRRTILALVVIESATVAAIGALLGALFSHAAIALGGGLVQQEASIQIERFNIYAFEPLILVAVILLGALAGLIPAVKGYRTDVQENLAPVS